MRKKHLTLLLTIFTHLFFAQANNVTVKLMHVENQQKTYGIGDTVHLKIIVITPPEICLDGMSHTKIYLSGLSVLEENDWQQSNTNTWTKYATYRVINNKKKESKISIVRKADKGSFFYQKHIKKSN